MEVPVTSLGKRSGVNWIRLNEHPMERAIALVRTVLPTPGTSSINTCPWQMTAMRLKATDSPLPTITFSTFATTRWTEVDRSCTDCMHFSPIHLRSDYSIDIRIYTVYHFHGKAQVPETSKKYKA